MITRFYVDNYKCLVNFEYKPQPLELIIGANGSGKSTVFEALDKVRQFVTGKADARELFPTQNGTQWNTYHTTVFEIDLEFDERSTRYRLELNLWANVIKVEKESIGDKNFTMIESAWKKSDEENYYIESPPDFFDKHKEEMKFGILPGINVRGRIMSNPNASILSLFPMFIFAGEFESIFVHKLNPPLIASEFGKIAPRLNFNGSNFASYYLYVLQQKQNTVFEVISHLRNVLPGFDSFAVDEDFEQGKRRLMVIFKNLDGAKNNGKGAAPLKFSFDDLSDGQRALIVLYTLLFCALDENATLVIDEPENYISLRELQPLIMLMEDRIEEVGGQILLISHNQEFINMLTDRGKCVRFTRENNGHTRIAAFNPDSPLTAAEIVARGWEDDEQ